MENKLKCAVHGVYHHFVVGVAEHAAITASMLHPNPV